MSKSVTTTNPLPPIHPGEVLGEEFLAELNLSATAFAKHLGVPPNRITRVIAGQSAITADTAFLLSAALGTTPDFWLNLQSRFDLETARMDQALGERVTGINRLVA